MERQPPPTVWSLSSLLLSPQASPALPHCPCPACVPRSPHECPVHRGMVKWRTAESSLEIHEPEALGLPQGRLLQWGTPSILILSTSKRCSHSPVTAWLWITEDEPSRKHNKKEPPMNLNCRSFTQKMPVIGPERAARPPSLLNSKTRGKVCDGQTLRLAFLWRTEC